MVRFSSTLVATPHLRDFVRTSGISVPVANAQEIEAVRAAADVSGVTAIPDVQVSPGAVTAQDAVASRHSEFPVLHTFSASSPPAAKPDLTDITGDLKPTR